MSDTASMLAVSATSLIRRRRVQLSSKSDAKGVDFPDNYQHFEICMNCWMAKKMLSTGDTGHELELSQVDQGWSSLPTQPRHKPAN